VAEEGEAFASIHLAFDHLISYVESERGRPCRPQAVLTCEDSHVTNILWTATKEHSTEWSWC
jgi:hypothetical protein